MALRLPEWWRPGTASSPRIAVWLDRGVVAEIDRLVAERTFGSRGHAIRHAVDLMFTARRRLVVGA
ncbi:MAG TPA: ribbon-helix-helix domain-containing protein [Euzebya sp.]|nr:ribbon-helix-helix domain-containing protein [Euzebya sp.]